MAQYFLIGGVKFYRRSRVKLSSAERAELAASGRITLRRRVEWPLAEQIPDFKRAYRDEGGTDLWGPGPYLKVPNRYPGADWEAVNRVFCPWGYPPDRVRIAWSSTYLRIAAVELARCEGDGWEWLLALEPWSPQGCAG